MTKYKTAKNDRIFKEIFKTKIEILNSENTELNNRNIKSKRKTVDSILKTNIGIINIESNADYKNKTYVKYRNGSFISGVYATYTQRNKNYNGHIKVYQVNLNYNTSKKTKKRKRILFTK